MANLGPVYEHENESAPPIIGGLEQNRVRRESTSKMAANGCHQKTRVNGFDDIPRPFFIGVAGGTASGKSSVCNKIMEQLGQNDLQVNKKQQVAIVSMETFYKHLNAEEQALALKGRYNFDHPGAFDEKLIIQTLHDLQLGKTVTIAAYDAINMVHHKDKQVVQSTDVIIFEGLLPFYFPKLRSIFNMKLFVDTDADTRLSRRVMRDMKERGRELDQILHQYTTHVKPAFEEFCLPTKKYADVIIPRGADNVVAIDLIVQSVQDLLRPNKDRAKRVRHNSDSLVSRPH